MLNIHDIYLLFFKMDVYWISFHILIYQNSWYSPPFFKLDILDVSLFLLLYFIFLCLSKSRIRLNK